MRRWARRSTRVRYARRPSPAPSAPPSSGTTTSSTAPPPRWSSRTCSSRTSSHYVGTLESFATYFVGFAARPDRRRDLRPLGRPDRAQGDADRHAAADGAVHHPDRRAARRRRLGQRRPAAADPAAGAPGHRGRRRVERLGAAVDGVGRPEAPRADGQLAAARRRHRPDPRHRLPDPAQHRIGDDAFTSWGWRVPFLLSIVLVAIGLYIRLQILETPMFAKVGRGEARQQGAGARGDQEAPEGDPAVGAGADVGADAVLRGHRVRAVLPHRRQARLQQELRADRHADRRRRSSSCWCPTSATCPTPSGRKKDLHDRRRDHGRLGLRATSRCSTAASPGWSSSRSAWA